jgi:two-component system LytT family sensor kinase
MNVVLGVVLGMVLSMSAVAAWQLVFRRGRVVAPEAAAMQAALHATTSLLPPLRQGLTLETAKPVASALRVLTGADAIALAGPEGVLAFDGVGADHHGPGEQLDHLARHADAERVHVERSLRCEEPDCPLRSAILAPLFVQQRRIGTLVAFYDSPARLRLEESRVVTEAAALVAALVQLSEMEAQSERLARAELRSLRAQISPHFIYNALAAVAASIRPRPAEARELLTEFAEFIRYAFAGQRPYVTLADELGYVERYLRLEQARFGERMRVSVDVDPDILPAAVPVLSVQPLVENAVRHGVESRPEGATVEIHGRSIGSDVQLTIRDDGVGIEPDALASALAGAGRGIGLWNVQSRLQATFGEGYGLEVRPLPTAGTEVIVTLPKFSPGVRPT